MKKLRLIATCLSFTLCASATPSPASAADDILINDFEVAGYGDWKAEGEAFGAAPAKGPAHFKKNNPRTLAGILHSTAKKPGFWDGSGTARWHCSTARSPRDDPQRRLSPSGSPHRGPPRSARTPRMCTSNSQPFYWHIKTCCNWP